MNGHQIILTYVTQHLDNDRMWRILGKASNAPVSIPDVMRKYRTVHRIIHELNGRVVDNRHTICKVSKFIRSQARRDDSSCMSMQNNICEAMEVEESWADEALDTLRLLELYGEDGRRYEDSRVCDLLEDDKTVTGQPRIRLLKLLKRCDIDWLKDSAYPE
jgi:hypothetical protein